MVPDLIVLALDYFRTPLRYAHLADPDRPLPKGFDNLVSDFGVALARRNIEATGRALGVRPDEIDRASRFFLRQVLLSPRSNYYRVLGLSPNASDETIHRNYRLLIRIFHPDRSVGDTERDAAYTARINEAYNALKHPAARQRYDRQLTSNSSRGETTTNPQPLSPTVSLRFSPFRGRFDARWPARGDRLTVFLVIAGVAAVLAAASAILLSNGPPTLRANPDRAGASAGKPSYLREPPLRLGAQPGNRGSRPLPGVAARAEGPKLPLIDANAKVAPSERTSSRRFKGEGASLQEPEGAVRHMDTEGAVRHAETSSAGDGGGPRVASLAEAHIEGLIARLTSYYQAGDLHGLVDLFTANARVKNGSGKDFIRAEYAGFFAEAPERRLSVANLKWRSSNSGKLIGQGVYQARVKDTSGGEWRSSSGVLLIELAPGASGFMISELIFR